MKSIGISMTLVTYANTQLVNKKIKCIPIDFFNTLDTLFSVSFRVLLYYIYYTFHAHNRVHYSSLYTCIIISIHPTFIQSNVARGGGLNPPWKCFILESVNLCFIIVLFNHTVFVTNKNEFYFAYIIIY